MGIRFPSLSPTHPAHADALSSEWNTQSSHSLTKVVHSLCRNASCSCRPRPRADSGGCNFICIIGGCHCHLLLYVWLLLWRATLSCIEPCYFASMFGTLLRHVLVILLVCPLLPTKYFSWHNKCESRYVVSIIFWQLCVNMCPNILRYVHMTISSFAFQARHVWYDVLPRIGPFCMVLRTLEGPSIMPHTLLFSIPPSAPPPLLPSRMFFFI